MKKLLKELIVHPLFSGSAIMVIGSNSTNFINYLYHFVMGRMLGPSGYGELVSLISLISLLGMIPASVSIMIVKYVSSAKKEQDVTDLVKWFKIRIFRVALIFSIIILIVSPIIASFLNIKNISLLILIATSFLFSIQSGLNRSILQGLLKFREMVSSILFENGAKLIISIVLVYLGFQVGGVMSALVLSSLLGLYVTNLYLGYRTSNTRLSPNVKSMITFIIPVTIQSIAIASLYSSDVILVKHFLSSYEAGVYAALSTLGKIIFFGTGPISAVMFPLVSQREAKGQSYRKILVYSFLLTGVVAALVTIIYWQVPAFAISLLYGNAYIESSNLLVWFGVFMTLFTFSSLLINFNLSLGKTKIVILPLVASFMQIVLIWFFHQNMLIIILESLSVTALLLVILLIYSTYGHKPYINNSARF